ncbi:MAG TPA: elongation factor G [Planctomycetota bacterium]|nr:elongation factor G [Planctomycetota bacterium]
MTTLDKIRNFGIIAHIDAGKTTTSERVLYYTLAIHRVGNVDEGTTTTDWYILEKQKGITIFSAAVTCEWRGHMLNLIDTPGHVDFTAEVERSLRVLDGAVIVFDAVNGVEAQSETVWRQAVRYSVPRLAYVNKMDRPGASFEKTLEAMRKKLDARPVAVTIPYGIEGNLKGVIHLVTMKLLTFEGDRGKDVVEAEIPADAHDEAQMYREQLIDAASEFSDEVLTAALDGKPVTAAALNAAIRKGAVTGKIQPTFAGSSLHNQGVQPVIDAVVEFLPSPLDVPVVTGKNPETDQPMTRDARKDKSLTAFAFKTATDKHTDITYVRVYTGELHANEAFYNPRLGRMERTQQMFRMFADERKPIATAGPGEIVAFVGLKQTVTGDTLCDKRNPILLPTIQFPEPVLSIAIEPKSSADKDKLDEVLARLAKDDPTFRVSLDADTGQIILHCMGEVHADVLLFRIRNDFGTPANVGTPRVAYKEAITRVGRDRKTRTHTVGETFLYGEVELEVRPLRDTIAPTLVTSDLTPNQEKDLRKYLPAIKAGALTAAGSGPIAGFPVIYLQVALLGGSVNANSSEEMYTAAASDALAAAMGKSGPQILEPHMKFEVTVPDEYAGGVINDLQRRGADITDMGAVAGARVVRGNVALSKMFGYSTMLRSLTQGRGQHAMEPYEYKPIPAEEMKKFTE